MSLLLWTHPLSQPQSLGDEVHPLLSLRAEGEAISSFLDGRLPRRPYGLLAMTKTGRVLHY